MTFPPTDVLEALHLFDKLISRTPIVGPCFVDRPLVLYGAGNMGRIALDLMHRLNIKVEYIIDQFPPPERLINKCISVLTPEEVPLEHRGTHMLGVCVVFSPYEPISTRLMEMGWLHVTPFYDIAEAYIDRIPAGNSWFSGPLENQEADDARFLILHWDDDYSRAAYLQFFAWRMHREEWVFIGAPVTINDRFFIEPIKNLLNINEVFLDVGACRGEVVEDFLRIVDNVCSGIIAIESDVTNIKLLRRKFSMIQSEKYQVKIMQRFLGKNRGLKINRIETGSVDLDVSSMSTTIVSSLDEMNLPATFAKIHLAGDEYEVLLGGINWLRNQRPILAVTIYFSRDGLTKIPKLLMKNLPEYSFILRDHAWCGTGVVMYAIPKERYSNS